MTHGPMQWTPQGLVPAITGVVRPGGIQHETIYVDSSDPDDDDAEPEAAPILPRSRQPIPPKVTGGPAKSASPKNVVALAKARLREVKAELRRMKSLEKERDQLQRLVEAAENKPRAIVREIKRSAG